MSRIAALFIYISTLQPHLVGCFLTWVTKPITGIPSDNINFIENWNKINMFFVMYGAEY